MDQRGGCGTQTRRVMTGAQKTNYHSETHGLPKALMHVRWSLRSHFVQSLDLKKRKQNSCGNSVICFRCSWESQEKQYVWVKYFSFVPLEILHCW